MIVQKTKKGYPVVWEQGGNGFACIIADRFGNPKKPLFINRDIKENGEHALFVIEEGDILVETIKTDKINLIVYVCKNITDYNTPSFERRVVVMEDYKDTERYKVGIKFVMQASIAKSMDLHCKEVYYADL